MDVDVDVPGSAAEEQHGEHGEVNKRHRKTGRRRTNGRS